jgi:hypothetical protein
MGMYGVLIIAAANGLDAVIASDVAVEKIDRLYITAVTGLYAVHRKIPV